MIAKKNFRLLFRPAEDVEILVTGLELFEDGVEQVAFAGEGP